MSPPIRILYLVDSYGWAIDNVGHLWLDNIPGIDVTFEESRHFQRTNFRDYDLVWFGYLNLFLDHYCRSSAIGRADLTKCVVSVHDPLELFPQTPDWRSLQLRFSVRPTEWAGSAKLRILQTLPNVVTASAEMKSVLADNKVDAILLPTASSLPERIIGGLETGKCSVLSVYNLVPRKNAPLIETLRQYAVNELGVGFDTKTGKTVLPEAQYLELLDSHEIYLCASYQEGGPLPAMDAMRRGCLVLSTPVGQLQEIIVDGESGFICHTKEEFIERLTLLANNLELLHTMRLASIRRCRDVRAVQDIKLRAQDTVNQVCESIPGQIKPTTLDALIYLYRLVAKHPRT